jgi:hypothetical protein
MKVFISWSGERSKAVALELREWIPLVIQNVDPWMSRRDIDAGARWNSKVSQELDKTNVGIICLTKQNCEAPWILFEAGALAKKLTDNTLVCPYLIDLKDTEIPGGPLTQFQAKIANEEGTWDLISTINKTLGDKTLGEDQLKKTFKIWWPELNEKLDALRLTPADDAGPNRTEEEMIEEILEIVRGLSRQLSQPVLGWGSPLNESLLRLLEGRRGAGGPVAAIFPDIEPGESFADYARRTRCGWGGETLAKVGWGDPKGAASGAEENND